MAAPPAILITGRHTRGPERLEWASLAVPGLLWGASVFLIAQTLEALIPPSVMFLGFVIGCSALSLIPFGIWKSAVRTRRIQKTLSIIRFREGLTRARRRESCIPETNSTSRLARGIQRQQTRVQAGMVAFCPSSFLRGSGVTVFNERSLAHFARLGLRFALGTAFLSAVAGRFGLWHLLGHPGGGWAAFLVYAGEVNWYLPKGMIPFIAVAATICEMTFGLCLIIGFKLRWAAFGSSILLMLFALAMASGDPKSPFDYSVFTASFGALTLATNTSPRVEKGSR